MEYRRLGNSGLKVSWLSFGSWVTFSNQMKLDEATACINYAYDQGVNFFDNAEVYAAGDSEILMGESLKKLGFARDSYCVSSKVFWGGSQPTQRGLSKKHIHDACHSALKRLQVDYLDLYFCHRPDPETPVLETVLAMNDLITQGKILYWGTSEWGVNELKEAYRCAHEYRLRPPTMEQPEYNLFNQKNLTQNLAPFIREHGLGTTIWSPLCSGWLTGKYQQGIPENSRFNLPGYEWLRERYESEEGRRRLAVVDALLDLAKKRGVTLTQCAVAWCLKNELVSTVILGASSLEQLKETLASQAIVSQLDESFMAEIDAIVNQVN